MAWANRELRRRQAVAAKGRGSAALSMAEVSALFRLPEGTLRRILRDQCDCMPQRVRGCCLRPSLHMCSIDVAPWVSAQTKRSRASNVEASW